MTTIIKTKPITQTVVKRALQAKLFQRCYNAPSYEERNVGLLGDSIGFFESRHTGTRKITFRAIAYTGIEARRWDGDTFDTLKEAVDWANERRDAAVAASAIELGADFLDPTCSTCNEPYTQVPTWRATLCSNSFHCCRRCRWIDGRVVEHCDLHADDVPGAKGQPLWARLVDYERDGLEEQETVVLFQELVDKRLTLTLQGDYGQIAASMIKAGLVTLPCSESESGE